jgi:hypothetical protein
MVRNVLLQLHVGQPVHCKTWTRVPVAHGLQLTIYTDSAGGLPERLATHLYAMMRRELVALGGAEADAPCTVSSGWRA